MLDRTKARASQLGVNRTQLVALFVVSTLNLATSAQAGPRLVRIIWDLGQSPPEELYYKEEPFTETGVRRWVVPPKDEFEDKGIKPFNPKTETILRKGDQVRVYLVNYNPVSHVHEKTVVTIVPPAPSTIGAVLNATALALLGGAALPKGMPMAIVEFRPSDSLCRGELAEKVQKLTKRWDHFEAKLRNLRRLALGLGANAREIRLDALSEILPAIPTHEALWSKFDNHKAWYTVLGLMMDQAKPKDAEARGRKLGNEFFDNQFNKLGITKIERLARELPTELLKLDDDRLSLVEDLNKKLGKQKEKKEFDNARACAKRVKILSENLSKSGEKLVPLLKFLGDPNLEPVAIITKYKTVRGMYKQYKTKLTEESWAQQAVEITVPTKGVIPEDASVRLDAIFKSPDKESVAKIQRSLVLKVGKHYPLLVIGVGVGFNALDFRKLALVKDPTTDSKGAARDRLIIVDDDSYNNIVPVWIQNIKVVELSRGGAFYGTFGTTPDRNIFKDLILGGSFYYSPWRTTFTVGALGAKGSTEEDLEPITELFSDDDGFALGGVKPDNVPMADRWQWALYFSVAFTLYSR